MSDLGGIPDVVLQYSDFPEYRDQILNIYTEYQNAIDKLIQDTAESDAIELMATRNKTRMTDKDISDLATESTIDRMAKYSKIFYDDEINRIFDSYNNDEYTDMELKFRCKLLTAINDSMQDVKL